jgi:hypothetical protein
MKDLQMLIKDIAAAIEMNGFKSYLNKETQDVQMLPDELHIPYTDMDMFQELLDKLEANPEQYIEIESLSSREGFILMEDFAANLKDKNTQNRLYNALSRPKPFRQFRYALEDNDLLQQWYAFKDAYYEQLAKEWLTKNFIHLHS